MIRFTARTCLFPYAAPCLAAAPTAQEISGLVSPAMWRRDPTAERYGNSTYVLLIFGRGSKEAGVALSEDGLVLSRP